MRARPVAGWRPAPQLHRRYRRRHPLRLWRCRRPQTPRRVLRLPVTAVWAHKDLRWPTSHSSWWPTATSGSWANADPTTSPRFQPRGGLPVRGLQFAHDYTHIATFHINSRDGHCSGHLRPAQPRPFLLLPRSTSHTRHAIRRHLEVRRNSRQIRDVLPKPHGDAALASSRKSVCNS